MGPQIGCPSARVRNARLSLRPSSLPRGPQLVPGRRPRRPLFAGEHASLNLKALPAGAWEAVGSRLRGGPPADRQSYWDAG